MSDADKGSMTARAWAAIGEQKPRDYVLSPETHAAHLPSEAAPLAEILRSDRLRKIIEDYNFYGSEVARWRYTLARFGRAGIWSAVGAVFVALVAMVTTYDWTPMWKVLHSVAVWGLLVTSWISFSMLGWWRPKERWYRARANAEHLRKVLFEEVFAAKGGAVAPGQVDLFPLKLAYFNRYQFNVQRIYYDTRGDYHARRAKFAMCFRICAFFATLLALAGTFMATVHSYSEQGATHGAYVAISSWSEFISHMQIDDFGTAVAIALSVVSAGLFADAMLDNHLQLARRYKQALRRMEGLAAHKAFGFDVVRRFYEAGDKAKAEAVAGELVREIHTVMSAELAEWVTIGTEASTETA